MRDSDALGIIKALADGVDPINGEVFPEDSPYQNAQIARALCVAVGAIEEKIKKVKRKLGLPERAGKSWGKTESDMLVQKFDNGISIIDLAKEHKRTRGAIGAQLAKLGKIELPYQRRENNNG